jgi:hypothetical protein
VDSDNVDCDVDKAKDMAVTQLPYIGIGDKWRSEKCVANSPYVGIYDASGSLRPHTMVHHDSAVTI